MIEDTLLPRAFGEKKPTVISLEEGVGKMRAALAAREDKALTIIGRTSSPSITGLADGIKRLKAYEAAGVDALFIAGGLTRADLDAIAGEVKIPLMLGGVSGDMQDKDYLASRGVRIALQGHQPFSAAVKAIYDTLKALREGTKPSALTGHRLVRDDGAGHPGRRLQKLDREVPGLRAVIPRSCPCDSPGTLACAR